MHSAYWMWKRKVKVQNIKPIETKYKGYRFRSRLEARYAVFFDALGVKWEYEKEGFNLPSGQYLPDFWLPEWNAWFEVKPEEGITDKARTLAKELCEVTNFAVLVSEGLPKPNYQGVIFYKGFTDIGYGLFYNADTFAAIRLDLETILIRTDIDLKTRAYSKIRLWDKFRIDDYYLRYGLPETIESKFVFIEYTNKKPVCVVENCSIGEMYRKRLPSDSDDATDGFGNLRNFDGLSLYPRFRPFVHRDFYDRIKYLPDDDEWVYSCVGASVAKAKSARFEHGESGI